MKKILQFLFGKSQTPADLKEQIIRRNGRMRWVKIYNTNRIQLRNNSKWITVFESTSDHEAKKFFI